MRIRTVIVMFSWLMCLPGLAAAQHGWVGELSVGFTGLVDDATKGYRTAAASVRRHLSPRITIGPEVVVMSNAGHVRDRNIMLTGNVVIDATDTRQVTPFVVAGLGIFWGRDQVRGGPYWSSDPAFTAGGGLRVRASEAISIVAEYRIGWELHQRITAGVSARW